MQSFKCLWVSIQRRFLFARSFNAFTAETLVHTDEGQKPIEEIKEGDKVLAEDPATGEQGYASTM